MFTSVVVCCRGNIHRTAAVIGGNEQRMLDPIPGHVDESGRRSAPGPPASPFGFPRPRRWVQGD